MKKLLAIGGIIVVVFILIAVLTNKSNEAKLKDNPYGTNDLETSTIDLLGNEHYRNIVMPDTLLNRLSLVNQSLPTISTQTVDTACK